MSYECIYCNFSAPTNTRLKRHLQTQKHARNLALYNKENNVQEETKQIVEELIENVETIENVVLTKEILDKEDENIELCRNTDCEMVPPESEEDTEEQWVKCNICPGYFNDDGLGDILFIEEEPNDRNASCDLCGKNENIVQMKGTGQYICGNACDEEEEEESVQEESREENNKNDDFDIPFESFFLDIQAIEMFVKLNELITTHPFTLQIICFFMNIVRWFRLPTAPYDQKS